MRREGSGRTASAWTPRSWRGSGPTWRSPRTATRIGTETGYSIFKGPKAAGRVTPGTIFRGMTAGDLIGPWLSQFLLQDIPFGALRIPQRIQTVVAHRDYLTAYADWLAAQRGYDASGTDVFDSTPRYIRNLRDLSQWVHVDALYQAYLQACLILLGLGAPLLRSSESGRAEP